MPVVGEGVNYACEAVSVDVVVRDVALEVLCVVEVFPGLAFVCSCDC